MVAKTRKNNRLQAGKANAKKGYSLRSQTQKVKLVTKAKNPKSKVPAKRKMIKKAPKPLKSNKKPQQPSIVKVKVAPSKSKKKSLSMTTRKKSKSVKLPLKRAIIRPDQTFIQNMLSSRKLKCERPKELKKQCSKSKSSKVSKTKQKPNITPHAPLKLNIICGKKPKLPMPKPQKAPPKRLGRVHQIPKQTSEQSENHTTQRNIQSVKYQQISPRVKLQEQCRGKSLLELQNREQIVKERLFLISAKRTSTEWILEIGHLRGRPHNIFINSEAISCKCIHFRIGKKCEDVNFLASKILQNDELTFHLKFKAEISELMYSKIDEQLTKRLACYIDESLVSKQREEEQACLICFNKIDKDVEALEQCRRCNHIFHQICLEFYTKSQFKCPTCRGPQPEIKHQELAEPIQELEQLQI